MEFKKEFLEEIRKISKDRCGEEISGRKLELVAYLLFCRLEEILADPDTEIEKGRQIY